jgi:hypothetical protein
MGLDIFLRSETLLPDDGESNTHSTFLLQLQLKGLLTPALFRIFSILMVNIEFVGGTLYQRCKLQGNEVLSRLSGIPVFMLRPAEGKLVKR